MRRLAVLPVADLFAFWFAFFIASGVGLVGLQATAWSDGEGHPVLHEYLGTPLAPIGGRAGELPAAVTVDGDRIPAPDASDLTGAPGEPLLTADRAPPTATLDRATEPPARLDFVAVFNPTVVPFKRGLVLDAVEEDGRLAIGDASRHPIPLTASPSPDRDLFWGSVLVDLAPGAALRLPTPAAGCELISYRIEPSTPLTFLRDGADNLYLETASASGRHRLVYLLAAPTSYFGATLPPDASDAEIPLDLRPHEPAEIATEAKEIARRAGARDELSYVARIDRLVAYFRAFTPGAPPTGRDAFVAIATAQRGVCRQRAFAFVVTAEAIGVPARYVANEGHVFVEVYVPRVGWFRIDLGGAADHFAVISAAEKKLYRPRLPDPFPRPLSFATSYTNLGSSVTGLSESQRRALVSRGRSSIASDGVTSSPGEPPGRARPDDQAPPSAGGGTRTLELSVLDATGSGIRGEALLVTGAARAAGGGPTVAGLRVDVWLDPAVDEPAAGARVLLGQTVTGADGRFALDAELPISAPLGSARVIATTPGDATFAAAISH